MYNNQGKYYLVCSLSKHRGLANYKIDKMSNVKILDLPAMDVREIEGYERGLDIAKYVNENIYAFGGKTTKAVLLIHDPHVKDYILDWFDDETRFFDKDGKSYAEISANENALVYWCLQYGESIELISPAQTRDKIKSIIETMAKRYN